MSFPQVRVVGMRVPTAFYPGYTAVNTTSRATTEWERSMSPFFVGPVAVYGGRVSKNFENLWQFSKVYPEHAHPKTGEPLAAYFEWAEEGWADERAHRYPMGKGRKPLFSYWDGKKMGYVEARNTIYCPLYARAVIQTEGFKRLVDLRGQGSNLLLRDFDGYDHVKEGLRIKDVFNDPERKAGHAFVIAALLTDDPVTQAWGLPAKTAS